MKATLLLVEDDADLARGLRFNLVAEGYSVQHAPDLKSARALLRESGGANALVILDLTLPDGDGLALLQELRVGDGATPVICLTARSQETDVVGGLRLGADDYVTKPFGLAQLLARVEAVLRRTRRTGTADAPATTPAVPGTSADLLELGPCRVDLAAHTVKRPDGSEELTPIETQLLRYFLARRGRALEREQILKDLWGVNGRHTTRTLDNHVARLRKKIEPDPANPRFLVTAHGVGYRFDFGTTSVPG